MLRRPGLLPLPCSYLPCSYLHREISDREQSLQCSARRCMMRRSNNKAATNHGHAFCIVGMSFQLPIYDMPAVRQGVEVHKCTQIFHARVSHTTLLPPTSASLQMHAYLLQVAEPALPRSNPGDLECMPVIKLKSRIDGGVIDSADKVQ